MHRLMERMSVVINRGTAAMVIAGLDGQYMPMHSEASHLLAL